MNDDTKKRGLYDAVYKLFNEVKEYNYPFLDCLPIEVKTFFAINKGYSWNTGYEYFSIELLKKLKVISDIREIIVSTGMREDKWFFLDGIDTFKVLNYPYQILVRHLREAKKLIIKSKGRISVFSTSEQQDVIREFVKVQKSKNGIDKHDSY